MFGFSRKRKIRKAVAAAFASVRDEADLADHAALDALPPELRPDAYYTLAHALLDDERYVSAKHTIDRALVVAPDEADLHRLAATVARELGAVEPAIAAQERVVAARPTDTTAILGLAGLLITAERFDEVITRLRGHASAHDPEVQTRLAEALFLRGEAAEAFAILDVVCKRYEALARTPWSTTDRQGQRRRAKDADRLREDVYAELHGREATIELAAGARKLDGRAGVNFRLLGARLAAQSERVADVLELQSPEVTEARGHAAGSTSAAGRALIGSAQLRRGELSAARKSFERASELDGTCFAAFFGLGAVLDHDKHSLHRRAAKLDVRGRAPAGIATVVPDWDALTEVEQHLVWACAQPFSALLPALGERGVVMRVLPLDVRATDIGLFEHIAGKRAPDDHRSYDALGGVATQRGAIAKVEGLLQIIDSDGWTLAHELAHLVYFHLDDARAAPFVALFERARAVGYANTDYALRNDDELFAVTYTDFLRQRYGMMDDPIADDAGIQDALMQYFTELCAAR